jgi:enoyl-CoA hydratase/carnithine racemase
MFPVQKVRYMYFTGEFIDANEAHRLGAVERVVPRDQLAEAARSIAAKIAEKSPIMISLAKEALNGIEMAISRINIAASRASPLRPIDIRTRRKRAMHSIKSEMQNSINSSIKTII